MLTKKWKLIIVIFISGLTLACNLESNEEKITRLIHDGDFDTAYLLCKQAVDYQLNPQDKMNKACGFAYQFKKALQKEKSIALFESAYNTAEEIIRQKPNPNALSSSAQMVSHLCRREIDQLKGNVLPSPAAIPGVTK